MKTARVAALLGAALLIAACGSAASPSPTVEPPTEPPASNPPASVEATQIPGPGAPERTTITMVQGSDRDFISVPLTKLFEYLKDKYGVTVEFSSVVDTDTATRAVIAGQADLVVNSLYFGVNANKAGIPLRTFVVDAQAVAYLLMSTPSIDSVEALVGGKVGINKPGDLGSTVVDQCLKSFGVDPAQIEYVQVGGTSARMAALLANQIDAAPGGYAEALNAQKKGALKILADCGKAIGSFLQTGVSTTEEWLSANPNLAQIFTDEYINALRWAVANKDEYIALSKEILPELDDDVRGSTYDLLVTGNVFAVNGGLTAESVQKFIDIGLDAGAIEEPVPDNWYTMQFVESYLARFGEQ